MKHIIFRKILACAFIAIIFVLPFTVEAAILKEEAKGDLYANSSFAATQGGFENTSASTIVAVVIKSFLGLLGIIFVVLIVTAGYKYMTAQGDEGKVEEALGSIKRAIIGLVIIVGAYAITAFIFKNLPDSASGGSNGAQFSN